MKKTLLPSLGLIASLLLSQHTLALTFKTGEVIGPDGKSYVGMSPQNRTRLLAANPDRIKSGVMSKQFFLVYNNQLITIPVTELRNKTSEERMSLIMQNINNNTNAQVINIELSDDIDHPEEAFDDVLEHASTRIVNDAIDQEIQESNELEMMNNHLETELNDHLEIELNDHLETELNDLEDELEHSLGHDLENQLDSVFDDQFENEINEHLEQNHGYDEIGHNDSNDNYNDSHDDNDHDD